MRKQYIIVFTLILLSAGRFHAQDVHFSQYNEMSAIINPALAGVIHDTRLTGSYRTQWGSVTQAYQTYGIAFEQSIKYKKLKGSHFAVSAALFRDVAGDAKLSNLNPSLGLNYVLTLTRTMKISAGVTGGFMYRSIDVNNLRWDNQFNGYEYDPTRVSGEPAVPRSAITAFDAGGGFNFNYAESNKFISSKDGNKFNIGVSGFHFEIPKNSFFSTQERLETRFVVYSNADVNIRKSKNAIVPSVIYMMQGKYYEFLAGAMFKIILSDESIRTGIRKPSALSLGGQYRYRDAIIPAVLWQYDKYAIGISYDINLSALTPASKRNGGLEIMLRYNTSPGYGRNLGRTDTKASY